MDLDWKVIADNGSVVQQGVFNNLLRGANTIRLGTYQPTPGQRKQIVLNVHQDVDQGGAHATLDVGPPEPAIGLSYDLPFTAAWTFLVGGAGFLLLLSLAIAGGVRRRKRGSPSETGALRRLSLDAPAACATGYFAPASGSGGAAGSSKT